MDRPFLKLMADSYVADKEIYKLQEYKSLQEAQDVVYRSLVNIVENVKYNDEVVYYELFELSRSEQQQCAYSLLDKEILNKSYFEESFLETVAGKIATGIAGGTSGVKAVTQGIITTSAGLNKKAKDVQKRFEETIKGKQASVIANILYNRLKICSQKCGIATDSDIHVLTPLSVLGYVYTRESKIQADCLVKCYLNFHKQMIKLLSDQYVQCVRTTSGQTIPGSKSPINIFQRYPMDNECRDLFDKGQEYIKQLFDTIDVIYGKNSPEATKAARELHNADNW